MLQIEHVSKDMGEFVLKDATLQVNDGEYLVIIGPTGAGKTILLETLAGIYPPDSGRMILDGRDITDAPPRERRISMVYQDYMLFPHLTVAENIGFGLKNQKVERSEIEEKVREAAQFLGIDHLLHRYPETLSGGEQQRAAIARAIVMEPALLLLDEPLSALDGRTREKLRRELRHLHDLYGITVIHVTHNFEEVFSLADRVAVIRGGEIVQVGEPHEVFRKPNCEFVANFVGVENLFKGTCVRKDGISEVTVDGVRMISTASVDVDEVCVSIRPEEILISPRPIDSSARNRYSGTVQEIADNGATVRITVDCGIPLAVLITRQGYLEMGLVEGGTVSVAFKASSVQIF
ncbi:ATP-binding cassette domain-containing protein [Methanofollis aquaemaris]|uniref:Molybdate/tungstate import ATP-binding protein WtpC n=1 Tax=Methanofollis aquaemaris TaxID=126734 RepID=A0A8A3S7H3_9EURY|nr:tungstate ABC transporter ATP-binding protein WtpC [Methanofollis aquaemaris]QSZ67681.1 ATP-binding cassette domain-containing protein [Methanofollis aquaemaris]